MSGSQLTPNSPAQQPLAAAAYPTDVLLTDQLNSDGLTYTTRGLPSVLLAQLLAGYLLGGAILRTGIGAPVNSFGNNGDMYLDTENTVIWGPKAAGLWPESGTSLLGNVAAETQRAQLAELDLQNQINALGAPTVATELVADGTTPATAMPFSASSNTFTTVVPGGFAISQIVTIGATYDVLNRGGGNILNLLPPVGWQFENVGLDQLIEVAAGSPGGGFVRIRNESEGVCRILSA